jgi:hypothetical protein
VTPLLRNVFLTPEYYCGVPTDPRGDAAIPATEVEYGRNLPLTTPPMLKVARPVNPEKETKNCQAELLEPSQWFIIC